MALVFPSLMAQREIVHRLSKCFQALPRRDWLANLVWHAKKGSPVLCGSMDHDWYIKSGFGSPAVMAVLSLMMSQICAQL